MPLRTLLILLGIVIAAAALTVAVITAVLPASTVIWAVPVMIVAALLARYSLSRL